MCVKSEVWCDKEISRREFLCVWMGSRGRESVWVWACLWVCGWDEVTAETDPNRVVSPPRVPPKAVLFFLPFLASSSKLQGKKGLPHLSKPKSPNTRTLFSLIFFLKSYT